EDAGVEHPRARSIVEQPDVPAEAAQMHREPAVRYEEGLAAGVAAVDEQYGAVPDGGGAVAMPRPILEEPEQHGERFRRRADIEGHVLDVRGQLVEGAFGGLGHE